MLYKISKKWIWFFTLGWGILVGLPFLAPALMAIHWEGMARAIYEIYSFLCHQLPQRSFFLFGPQQMYSLTEIQAVFQATDNPLLLRQFVGAPELGWKVAWSDRMVLMYTAMLPAAWLWYALRRRLKQLPVWGFALFLLPMAVDGVSHLISDLAGLGQGFRDTNLWLVALTGSHFPAGFYAGDALGSFNSSMRQLTGLLFAIGLVWFGFPHLEEMFLQVAHQYEIRFERLRALETHTH
ncbi:MAG: DUF2085 domain-containing protein [Anaerolineae bacterium]|nr:MAG: DUF2085 domain-containing protein [Anaerolineae bacterium]